MASKPVNVPGGYCANGHYLATADDISRTVQGGRCKACRRESTARCRGKLPKREYVRPTLLQIGHCLAGHPIRSVDDIKVVQKPGGSKRSCKICYKAARDRYEADRADKAWERLEMRRWIHLSCGCRLLFRPHYPTRGQQLWCARHEDYGKVRKIGEQITREEAGQR